MLLDIVFLITCPQIEFGLVEFPFVFGINNALDNFLDGVEVVVHKQEIVLVNVFDMFGEIAPLFVDHLSPSDDLGLAAGTGLVFLVHF